MKIPTAESGGVLVWSVGIPNNPAGLFGPITRGYLGFNVYWATSKQMMQQKTAAHSRSQHSPKRVLLWLLFAAVLALIAILPNALAEEDAKAGRIETPEYAISPSTIHLKSYLGAFKVDG